MRLTTHLRAQRAALAAGGRAGQHRSSEIGATIGGSGTQLAWQAAARQLPRYTDGVRAALPDADRSRQSGGGDELDGGGLRRCWLRGSGCAC